MGAHGMGQLDAHVAQAADPDDADLLTRAHFPVAKRRVSGDSGAQQRRHRRQLILRVANGKHEVLVDDDPLRIAAQCMPRRVVGRTVVGADQPLLAILLEPFVAGRARAATSHHAADPHGVADLESRDLVADRADMADDLVAGHAGIDGPAPFGTDGVEIGMADAAISDVDLDVLRPGLPAFDGHGLERLFGRMSTISAGRHRRISF